MNILILAAHPDDETLGCGATLLRHHARGDRLFWLIATRALPGGSWSDAVIAQKQKEVEQVAAAYPMQDWQWLNFPAARLDTIPRSDLIAALAQALDQFQPDCVYLPHAGDIHSDHRILNAAFLSAAKPFHSREPKIRRILAYETLSSTDAAPSPAFPAFTPNSFTRVSTAELDEKISLMSLYASEAQTDPAPRGPAAIRALARYRGATIGREWAEAFMLIREINE